MIADEPQNVVWVLDGYSKQDEFLRTRHTISRDQIIRLREVLTPDPDDPWIVYGYDVPVTIWPEVEGILHCGPPDPTLDYQTGCYRAD
ncbi:hypothetical protein ABTX80_32510 [Streptomyces erythrochromogenes]|uniref:DUF7683 domain-containing protein n=1 Tax=Streptomyces erythrochromogenes TaxID=285574 RepID=UPI003328B7F9